MVVVRIALPNFRVLLFKKSLSKVCIEKLCNPQELHKEKLTSDIFLKNYNFPWLLGVKQIIYVYTLKHIGVARCDPPQTQEKMKGYPALNIDTRFFFL
jgi:hypothetical protein